MTQEELAKKWAENYEADVCVHVYDAVLAALQEQEQIHPWADAEEHYKQLLDDFQGLAVQEPDHFNRIYVHVDVLKELLGYKARVKELEDEASDIRLERAFNDRD